MLYKHVYFILILQGSAAVGSLSKEDAAYICVEALDHLPQKGLIFEVTEAIYMSNFEEIYQQKYFLSSLLWHHIMFWAT